MTNYKSCLERLCFPWDIEYLDIKFIQNFSTHKNLSILIKSLGFQDEIARQMAAEYQGELSTRLILETMQPNTLNELAGEASGAKQPSMF